MAEQNPDNVRKIGASWTRIYMACAVVCSTGVILGRAYEPSACVSFLLGVVGYSVLAMVYGNRAE